MNEFEKQFQELKIFLAFEDYDILTKRIIDLTLDTESIVYYQSTNDFLDWLEVKNLNFEAKKQKFESVLDNLYQNLKSKPIVERKVLIKATKMQKSYGLNQFGLGPVDLELRQGEILGLVGENGNGKTTLLRLLCGELFATSGSLKFNFSFQDNYDLRTKLVYIPQRSDTWYGSMFENLQFTATSYGYSAAENALVVELIIARLGLRKFKNHAWKSLSSGYKMRFELARMLLRKPQILLIDEPLANLDILAQQTVLEDFRAIAKSPFRPIGIVLSSQQLYEVEKTSDQVIFLKNGIQKNLNNNTDSTNIESILNLVVELESSWNQADLANAFQHLNLNSLQFNGGTFIATFAEITTIHQLLKTIVEKEIPILYFRNITNSTRKFFVS